MTARERHAKLERLCSYFKARTGYWRTEYLNARVRVKSLEENLARANTAYTRLIEDMDGYRCTCSACDEARSTLEEIYGENL